MRITARNVTMGLCLGSLFRWKLNQKERILVMLVTIAVILVILWLLGLVSSYTMGGFIHILLVIAIVVILVRVIRGRNLDGTKNWFRNKDVQDPYMEGLRSCAVKHSYVDITQMIFSRIKKEILAVQDNNGQIRQHWFTWGNDFGHRQERRTRLTDWTVQTIWRNNSSIGITTS